MIEIMEIKIIKKVKINQILLMEIKKKVMILSIIMEKEIKIDII